MNTSVTATHTETSSDIDQFDAPFTPPSPSTAATPLSELDSEISRLLLQLESAEQRKIAAKNAEKQGVISKILGLPEMFGVASLKEVVSLIHSQGGENTPPFNHGNNAQQFKNKVFGMGRIPRQTLDQLKSMLKAGATIEACSKSLGVSPASVNTYKARWGMVKSRRAPGEDQAARHRRSNRYSPLSIVAREGIVQAIIAGKQTVAEIAKTFGTSRQSVYSTRARLEHIAA